MAGDKKKRFKKKKVAVTQMEMGQLTEEEKKKYMKDGKCFRCAKQRHVSRDCPLKATGKAKEKKEIWKMPRDAFIRIQAMFKEYSREEQSELLDIMEKKGF
uniref:CCHC-type domain-containing protein n=1 Tax=Moniliophthora roreri TaxID=221103 RepID=A0A0W0FZJ4_MONRR